jgi:transposase
VKWNSRRVSAWAYAAPADLRKGFDGLSALVANELRHNPLSGDLYLFVSRNRIRAKVLHWDGTGLCVYAKRLEKGRFACLWSGASDEPVQLTTTELSLFLEGSRLVGKITLSPPEMTQFSLAPRSVP